MDLLKSGITFTIGLIVTLTIVYSIQRRREAGQKRTDAFFALRLAAVDAFHKACSVYELASLAAYTDLYQWVGKVKTEAMQRYESSAYGEFASTLTSFRSRFSSEPRIAEMLDKLVAENRSRHLIYDSLVDDRLDNGPGTVIDPRSRRAEFDTHLATMRTLREDSIRSAEAILLAQ
jgi:hypothetical protein